MLMELFSRTIAALLIVLLSPFFLLIIISSILFQGLPVFFFQERIGKNYIPFQIVKFRTMMLFKSGPQITSINDSRITLWGRGLRLLKVDEIPQLWNIVNGEMRFVGPRPEVPIYVSGHDFSFLTDIKPGLTDYASIILRNEAHVITNIGGTAEYENILSVKIKLAHLYARNKSFQVDLVLVICTLLAIIFPYLASTIVQNLFVKRQSPEIILELKQLVG
jgi:lipopolysaccharide/colanic/teichoic acid biosynthesis glycosyltransferase